ncbi:hypothetical protein [Salinibacterium sp. ZJ450]|nr:hypothetical protein [Salinibacterium sp. ZJ450]
MQMRDVSKRFVIREKRAAKERLPNFGRSVVDATATVGIVPVQL